MSKLTNTLTRVRTLAKKGYLATLSWYKGRLPKAKRWSWDKRKYVVGLVVISFYVITINYTLALLEELPQAIAAGTFYAILITLFALPWIPGAIKFLSNDPNELADTVDKDERDVGEYPVSTFAFFTSLPPGVVKIIERDKRFMRCIMKFDNHTFAGENPIAGFSTKEHEYWEVVNAKENGLEDFHPIPDRGFRSWINPLWWWARYVYDITGLVFTGVAPYQTVKPYKLSRLRKVLNNDGSFSFKPITDYSDHYRVADVQIFVEVPNADTQDKVPVTVQKAAVVRVTNPYLTAYGTDDWSVRFFTAYADAINSFTRARPLDEVLSIKSTRTVRNFSKAILKQLNEEDPRGGSPIVNSIGMVIRESALIDISPTAGEKMNDTQLKLADEAFASVEAKANDKRGRGQAASMGHLIDGVITRGEAGLAVYNREADIRQAEAVSKSAGTIILDGGSQKTVNPAVAFLHKSIEGVK